MTGIKVIFGGAVISSNRAFKDKSDLEALFASLKKYAVKAIDTAQSYGNCEKMLESVRVGSQFIIDTKWIGWFTPDSPTKENIITTTKESMNSPPHRLTFSTCTPPDDSVPLSATLTGVNEAYKKGYFTCFGLFNYRVEDVETVHNHCNENGYFLPTVYQGNYSPVARKQDTLLFPTLRRLKIAFYAYNPLADGFLTKTKEQTQQGAGRFGDALGWMHSNMYSKPAYLDALSEWEAIAKEIGCSKADPAYRWVSYSSPLKPEQGDGIIVGASSLRPFEQTMEGLKAGPLPDEALKRIDHVWKMIEHDAPLDSYNDNVSLFKT